MWLQILTLYNSSVQVDVIPTLALTDRTTFRAWYGPDAMAVHPFVLGQIIFERLIRPPQVSVSAKR